jgi:hypothetical protein
LLHSRPAILAGNTRNREETARGTTMADPQLRDRMFQRILRGLVDTVRAPHYAELGRARGLGVPRD